MIYLMTQLKFIYFSAIDNYVSLIKNLRTYH